MIKVDNISMFYGSVQALDGVNFSVDKGEIFGLIGADGAGKTTMFRILTTLLLPAKGVAEVCGYDVVKDYRQIRQRVGYMPGKFSLYHDLSVEENLKIFASVFDTTVAENYELIEGIYKQLEPFARRRAGNLSGGMKQKLALCCALIHRPEVLFLDEPTTGVDPVSRKEFWQILQRLKCQGMTILVSTPYMDEALQCDRIAFIKQGRLLDIATPRQVIGRFGEPLWAVSADDMPQLLRDLRGLSVIKSCYTFGDHHHITFNALYDGTSLSTLLGDHNNLNITQIEPTIEDCYMKLTI